MPTPLNAHINGLDYCANYSAPTQSVENSVLLICLPGGGSSALYFDLHPDHSFTQNITALGHHIITMDHPGTASNKNALGTDFLTPRKAADNIHLSLMHFIDSLELSHLPLIGIGHSMGGMTTTLIQARHNIYKAIALFGSSAGGLDWGLSDEEKLYINKPDELERDLEKLTIGKFGRAFTEIPAGPSGKSITFGGETQALTQALRKAACELFGAGGMMSMVRGSFSQEVLAINVPIFFAFGDHDIGIPPSEAPKAYVNAPETELLILPETGHNHFAFKSISLLSERFHDWLSKLSGN